MRLIVKSLMAWKKWITLDHSHLGDVSLFIAITYFIGFMIWVFLMLIFVFSIVKFEEISHLIILPLSIFTMIPAFYIWASGFILIPLGTLLGIFGLFQIKQKMWISILGILLNILIFYLYINIAPNIHQG